MLGTQQYYTPQYSEQPAWQHGMQQESRHVYAQQPSKLNQDQTYTRIAVNQNHAPQNVNVRQAPADNTQESSGASLSALNQQNSGSPSMDQLSEENQKVLVWVAELMDPARREGALIWKRDNVRQGVAVNGKVQSDDHL